MTLACIRNIYSYRTKRMKSKIVMEEFNNATSVWSSSSAWYQVNGYTLCGISGLAFIENFVVLLIFYRYKSLRSPTNVFIISLAVSDLFMACIIPLSASSSISGRWIHGDDVCTLEAFYVFFVGMSSIYNLTAIALDRYIVITKPFWTSHITFRLSVFAASGCWLLGFSWALGPLFGWSGYSLEGVRVSCGLDWTRQDAGSQSYITLLFLFGLLVPMGIIFFSYYNVYSTVKRTVQRTADINSQRTKRNLNVEKKVAKTAACISCGFTIAWLPYAIVSFWRAFGDGAEIPLWLVSSPAIFAKCSCVWNPIIYVVTNSQFREAFYNLIPSRMIRDKLKSSKVPDVSRQETFKREPPPKQTSSLGRGHLQGPSKQVFVENKPTLLSSANAQPVEVTEL